jgi:16S rRNA (adenine1518-N6/adenine1519-N6)-dimethyltransferase
MTLSEIKRVLSEEGIQLTKSLGQSFLHDGNQLRRIVEASELSKQDRVVEIGPGLGPLTELLLAQAGQVLAIEKDHRLCVLLKRRLASATNLTLIEDDALDYVRRQAADWSEWKLVANLPYAIASPLLVELALGARSPRRIVGTLQLEVAQRLLGSAGEKDFGVLTLLVQLRYAPRRLLKIPAACFFPEPEVDSACIVLDRRAEELLPTEAEPVFVRLVKRSFSQRRKMMLKLLKQDWPGERLTAAFAEAGLKEQTRAETVRLEQFAQLARALHGAADAQHLAAKPR